MSTNQNRRRQNPGRHLKNNPNRLEVASFNLRILSKTSAESFKCFKYTKCGYCHGYAKRYFKYLTILYALSVGFLMLRFWFLFQERVVAPW